MNEEQKNEPIAEQEQTETPISREKRLALLRYLEILFIVAFVLVAISLFSQMRSTKTTLSDLTSTNASILSKAENLQNENRALLADNNALRKQISEKTAENQDLTIAYEALANVLASPYTAETIEHAKEIETVYNYRDTYTESAWSLFEAYMAQSEATEETER